MSSITNPYWRERKLCWHNRWQDWRADPGQTAVHALAWLALALAAALLLWQSWPKLEALLEAGMARWPLASAALMLTFLGASQCFAISAQRKRWDVHWLRLQPVPEQLYRQILLKQIIVRALLQAVALTLLLRAIAASATVVWISIALTPIAAAGGWLGSRADRQTRPVSRRAAIFGVRGCGNWWTWQRTEALAQLAPFRLARYAALLLLAPTGSWATIAGLMLLLMVSAALWVCWRQGLSVLLAATRWLQTESLPARRLVMGCASFLLVVLTTASVLLVLAAWSLNVGRWILPLLAGLWATALLQWAVTVAERHRPGRVALTFYLHLTWVLLMLQQMPILLLPSWIVQMVWLLRRGLRS